MNRKMLLGLLSVILIVLPLCPSCNGTETTPTATLSSTVTPQSTTTAAANWWDEFGEPEYGGELVIRRDQLSNVGFDPNEGFTTGYSCYLEGLFGPDWTLDRDIWSYNIASVPDAAYYTGLLAGSWEQTDPLTITIHLKEGIHWQDKEPVNGRELTADDVQYSYDRLLGTGNGFTEPNMFWVETLTNTERVVATDTYTVEFQLKQPGIVSQNQILSASLAGALPIIPREWVEQGDLGNWENVVGTGPWILTDFTSNVSMTFSSNPNYWGTDERYPENQLPYVTKFKYVAISDVSTALAAMRAGNLDMMVNSSNGISRQQAQTLAETNPEIQQTVLPSTTNCIILSCDQAPFTDINVRKALQIAVNRELIAETLYGGIVDGKPCGVAGPALKGWVTTYEEWPTELQAEYSYDVEGAKQLLADAGYPEGFDTNCVANTMLDSELLLVLQAQFSDVGVNMEIMNMDPGSFMSYCSAGNNDQMAYDQIGMLFSPEKTIYFRYSKYMMNFTRNNDAYYDGLVEEFQAATSTDEAKEIFKEADMYALSQHWSINVCPTANPIAWQPYVKGYSGELLIGASWLGYYEARLWIDQELKESMGH